jgi:dGTPase
LKKFDREHAYQHKSVLEVELEGYNTIRKLMDFLWMAIDAHGSGSKAPFESYGYIRISENYRRVFEDKENKMPDRYKQLQLLTDMISGMTDSFAISLCNKLQGYRDGSAH